MNYYSGCSKSFLLAALLGGCFTAEPLAIGEKPPQPRAQPPRSLFFSRMDQAVKR